VGASSYESTFVVEAFDLFTIGRDHVVALMQRQHSVLDLPGVLFAALQAEVVAKRNTAGWHAVDLADGA
jgi:hypothetical protein